MFGFFKRRRPSKTFVVRYIVCSQIDGKKTTFCKDNMKEFYVDGESMSEAGREFASFWYKFRSVPIFIYSIDEITEKESI